MFWTVLIAFAVVYLTQTFLALRQSKNFAAGGTSGCSATRPPCGEPLI